MSDGSDFRLESRRLERQLETDLGRFGIGTVANFLAQMGSPVPSLVLRTTIVTVFDESEYSLPVVSDAWLPTAEMAQFGFSVFAVAVRSPRSPSSPGSTGVGQPNRLQRDARVCRETSLSSRLLP